MNAADYIVRHLLEDEEDDFSVKDLGPSENDQNDRIRAALKGAGFIIRSSQRDGWQRWWLAAGRLVPNRDVEFEYKAASAGHPAEYTWIIRYRLPGSRQTTFSSPMSPDDVLAWIKQNARSEPSGRE